jgi:multidrug resistance efflux pump
MAVKFRRIEDRKESVMQLRRRRDERRQRRRVLPKLVTLLVLAGVGVMLYLYLRPPRVVGPALVRAEPVSLVAPVAGTLRWVLPEETKELRQGDTVARIVPDPETGAAARARLDDLRVSLARAAAEVQGKQQDRRALEYALAEKEARLTAELQRLEGKLAEAEADLQSARRALEQTRGALDSAERLARLGAAPEDEHARARTSHSTAVATAEKAEARVRTIRGEVGAAQEALEASRGTREAELRKADEAIRLAHKQQKEVEQALAAQREAMAGGDDPVAVSAPSSGVVLNRHGPTDVHLRAGDPILTFYRPEDRIVRAFVPARHRDSIQEGQSVRLYLPGIEQPLGGRVERIRPRIEALPSDLARGRGYEEPHNIPLDIRLTDPRAQDLSPGEAGKAVIGK